MAAPNPDPSWADFEVLSIRDSFPTFTDASQQSLRHSIKGHTVDRLKHIITGLSEECRAPKGRHISCYSADFIEKTERQELIFLNANHGTCPAIPDPIIVTGGWSNTWTPWKDRGGSSDPRFAYAKHDGTFLVKQDLPLQ